MQCSLDTNYPHVKFVARTCAPMASSPRILNRQPGSVRREATKNPLSQFIITTRAQASRRCETQAPLGGKLCYRFGPLTPSARSASLIAGDGMKNGFPAPNKELAINQKQLLDTKSPIQVCRLTAGGKGIRTLGTPMPGGRVEPAHRAEGRSMGAAWHEKYSTHS